MNTRIPHYNRRRHERFVLPPMYSAATVRRVVRGAGMTMQVLEGHAYDISESGIRLELDEPLAVGEEVRVTVELPGNGGTIAAWAEVVRVYDEIDDPGARRMALHVREFASPADHARLLAHISTGSLRRAA